MKRRSTFLISLALLHLSIPFAAAQEQAKPAEVKEPVVRLKALDGKTYDTTEMRGEVLVLSFGATWCVPCAWELKAVEELKEEYAGKPVRFFWISIEDQKRAPDSLLKRYAKSNRLTIPVLRDEDMNAFAQFSTNTRIPLVVYFDQQGRYIAPLQRGMSSDITAYKQRVRQRVNELLAVKTEAPAKEGEKTSP